MIKRIGIIGYGNMGSAIAGWIKTEFQLFIFDKDKNKTANQSGIKVCASVRDLMNSVDAAILAVKPQDFDGLLNELKGYLKGKLVISIAAGVTTAHIEKLLGSARVIRVMPNFPVKIKEGMTCICKGKLVGEEDLKFAEELFDRVGKTLVINENMMNAATAVSGSGPGFFCDLVEGKSLEQIKFFSEQYFIPYLTAAARNRGFSPQEAEILSVTTGAGAVQYLIKEGVTPAEVKKQVASQGGTTEAGLKELDHDIKNLENAVKAALRRAKELSREE